VDFSWLIVASCFVTVDLFSHDGALPIITRH
jgi:hypothetical protein